MKLRSPGLVVLAVFVAIPLTAQVEVPEAVVQAFHAALAAGDSSRARSLLAPEIVIFEGGGAELSRAEYQSHHMGADMAFARATTREVVDQRAGRSGDVAWVLTRTRTTGSFRGRGISSQGTETMILQRTPDGWQIAHIHWSSRRLSRPPPDRS